MCQRSPKVTEARGKAFPPKNTLKGIHLKKGTTHSVPEDVPIQPTYTLPFGENPVSHDVVFGLRGEDPILLRPNNIERLYGIPASTVYDWIHAQPETHFPAIKLVVKSENKRRMILIPKQLLDEWIVEH
jgi:hypothetical protein